MFTDETKYDRINSNFDFKLSVFFNICSRCDILLEVYAKALLNMLSEIALN